MQSLIRTPRRIPRPEGPRKMIVEVRHRGDQEWSPSHSRGERWEGAHSCAPRGHANRLGGRDSSPSGDGPSE